MKWRRHGANPDKLYEQFGLEQPLGVLDFSTNTNVLAFKDHGNIDMDDIIGSYPDDESLEIKRLISEEYGVPEENILVTNGSNEAIYIIASLYAGRKGAILQPAYSEYEKALLAYNVDLKHIYSIEELSSDIDILFICNPNNPDGRYFNGEAIASILGVCRKCGTVLVIDEAYADFLLEEERYRLDIQENPDVYILRSLTKNYHLSGVRLGYVISSEERIERLKERQPTWSVNRLSQHLAVNFLKDKEFLPNARQFYLKEKERVLDRMASLGYYPNPSSVHYFVLKVDDDVKIMTYLLKKGIVVRHTRDFRSLDGKYLRICVRTEEENNKLLEALEMYKNENIFD